MTAVHVLPRFRVRHEGRVYGPGDTLDVSDRTAAGWLASGSVEAVQPPPKTASKTARK